MVVAYDSDGRRQRRSRPTLKEADDLAREISQAMQEKVNGAMTLDDRQACNLAREIVEPFGYTVLQAVREWERSKAPYRGKKTADGIAELIASKRREQLSSPSVNRLDDNLKAFATVVPDEIEKVQAPHLKEFLNSREVGPRRWNNLCDQVVMLFRFTRSERYLPKDRTTEADESLLSEADESLLSEADESLLSEADESSSFTSGATLRDWLFVFIVTLN